MWSDSSTTAAQQFNNAIASVYSTWDATGNNDALQIKSVKVWQ
jgi:hypothetical protein